MEQGDGNENVTEAGKQADKKKMTEKGKVVEKENMAKGKLSKFFICIVCNKVEETREELNNHMKTHMNDEENKHLYVCDECPLSYASLGGLKRHKRNKHTPKGEFFMSHEHTLAESYGIQLGSSWFYVIIQRATMR